MKKLNIILAGFLIIASAGCKKYLDVNKNPNGPSSADPALYLPSIENYFAQGLQFDARGLGPYVQNFQHSSASYAWDLQGYTRSSDFGGELWKAVYWKSGQNTIDMINAATVQKKWDIVGAGHALQAYGWQMLTDYGGEIILKEAFDPARSVFDYDTQDTVYAYVERLCQQAITELNRTDDAVGSTLFGRFDQIYKGDRLKWKKFVYGILAINAHHLIKKPNYNPDLVIKYVDSSFTSNADDALVPFLATSSADANFFGTMRGNMGVYGQSAFVVRLMDGTVFSVPDPRLPVMLNPSLDGVYRGLTAGAGQSSAVSNSNTGVRSVWGTVLGVNNVPLGTPGKYLFQDDAPFPLMTYSELQFIKAEAALHKGDAGTALQAYTNGINASMDFVSVGATAPGATPSGAKYSFGANLTTFNAQKSAFLASTDVIPASGDLTINQILLQKYIALWSYGFIETWTDLRKYDYDPNVFTGFNLPTTFYVDNNGKPAYRVRPRYNSEYIWNIDALTAIGGFEPDYHTYKMWIQQ